MALEKKSDPDQSLKPQSDTAGSDSDPLPDRDGSHGSHVPTSSGDQHNSSLTQGAE